MIPRSIRLGAVVSCAAAVAALGAAPATAALPALPTAHCTGSTSTAVSPTAVTVTGTATCTGATTLKLTTTLDTSGALSKVTSLLPALPNLPVPISSLIPAVGVTSACSTLVDTGTGATVSTSCST